MCKTKSVTKSLQVRLRDLNFTQMDRLNPCPYCSPPHCLAAFKSLFSLRDFEMKSKPLRGKAALNKSKTNSGEEEGSIPSCFASDHPPTAWFCGISKRWVGLAISLSSGAKRFSITNFSSLKMKVYRFMRIRVLQRKELISTLSEVTSLEDAAIHNSRTKGNVFDNHPFVFHTRDFSNNGRMNVQNYMLYCL